MLILHCTVELPQGGYETADSKSVGGASKDSANQILYEYTVDLTRHQA